MFVTHDIDEAVKMGDRIAILEVGGVLAQYDAPAEVLGNPANDFVADFVGSDRGLKRLKVMPITDERARAPADRRRRPRRSPTHARRWTGPARPTRCSAGADGGIRALRQRHAAGDGVVGERAQPTVVVDVGRSLEDALAAILLTDDGFVAVFDGAALAAARSPPTRSTARCARHGTPTPTPTPPDRPSPFPHRSR